MDRQVREEILRRFVESGERERIEENIRTKLNNCGWQDNLRNHVKRVMKEKDASTVTVDELCDEVMPFAKDIVSEDVRVDAMEQIKAFLLKSLPEINNP